MEQDRHTLRLRGCEAYDCMVKAEVSNIEKVLEGLVIQSGTWRRVSGSVGLAVMIGLLGGCSDGVGGGPADPGAQALPQGESCGSVREQLNKLDRKGVQAHVEAQNAGRKLSASQKADADDYNRLLGLYLGSRCHV